MTHPPETDLALYAAGDLAWFRQWRTDRHVRGCNACQQVASEYSELCGEMKNMHNRAQPGNWARLSSEIKANVRLGLAAGECVVSRSSPRPVVSGSRLVAAGALLTVLFAIGAFVSRPDLHAGFGQRASGTILEAAGNSIQVSGTQQTLRIRNRAQHNVIYSVGAQGELRARSLDPETGNVSIIHVYGE